MSSEVRIPRVNLNGKEQETGLTGLWVVAEAAGLKVTESAGGGIKF